MKKIVLFIVCLSICSFFFNSVCAFGVVSPYSSDRPLEVYSGEINEAELQLVVGQDGEEVRVQAEMLDDAGIASFVDVDLKYPVSQGKPSIVRIYLDIPKDVSVGEEYLVKLRFTDITPSESEQMVSLRTGSIITLRPRVIEKPEEEGYTWVVVLIVLIVVVIGIIWFVMRKKRK